MTHFVSINHSCIGKPRQPNRETATKEEIKAHYASVNYFVNRPQYWSYFTDEQFYATLREYVTVRGHSFAGFMGDQMLTTKWFVNENYRQREKSNFAAASYVCLDFDAPKDGTPMVSWEEIQSNLKELGIWENVIFMYATPSYDPANGKNNCRVVLHIPDEFVYTNYEYVTKALLSKVPYADQACNDASRMWFGTPNCQRVECPETTTRMSQEKYEYFVSLGRLAEAAAKKEIRKSTTVSSEVKFEEYGATQSREAKRIGFNLDTLFTTKNGFTTSALEFFESGKDKVIVYSLGGEKHPSAFLGRVHNKVFYYASNDPSIRKCWVKIEPKIIKSFSPKKKDVFSPINLAVNELVQGGAYDQIMANMNSDKRNIVINSSPMGTGKTNLMSKLEGKVLYISHLSNLTIDASNRNSWTNYQDEDNIRQEEKLSICVNSTPRLMSENGTVPQYDWLIIDEAVQLVQSLVTNKDLEKHEILTAFMTLCKRAKNILLADAGYHITMWTHMRPLFADKNEELNIIHLSNDVKINTRVFTLVEKQIHVEMLTLNAYKNGKNIFLTTDSKTKTEELCETFTNLGVNPDEILVINADTPDVGKMLTSLEDICEKKGIRILIASPTIRTGVSLTNGYFNQVCGIFNYTVNCEITSVWDALQSVSRVRGSVPTTLCISDAGNKSKYLQKQIDDNLYAISELETRSDETSKNYIDTLIMENEELSERIENENASVYGDAMYERISSTAWMLADSNIKQYAQKFCIPFDDDVPNSVKILNSVKAYGFAYRKESTRNVRSKFCAIATEMGHEINVENISPEDEKEFAKLKKETQSTVKTDEALDIVSAENEELARKLVARDARASDLNEDQKNTLLHHQFKEMLQARGMEMNVKNVKKELRDGNIYKIIKAQNLLSHSDEQLIEKSVKDLQFKGAPDTPVANIAMKRIALNMLMPYLNDNMNRSARTSVFNIMRENPIIFNTARKNQYGCILVEDMMNGIKDVKKVLNELFSDIGISFGKGETTHDIGVDKTIFNLHSIEFEFINPKKKEPTTKFEKLAAAF